MVDLGFIKIDTSNFIAILIGIVVFAVQLVLLFKVKYLIIKLLPVFLAILFGMVCLIGFACTGGNGWDALGWLLLTVFDFIYFAVIAFAWLILGLVKLVKKSSK